MDEFSVVGKAVPRVDSRDKVTGVAIFTADIELPGMLIGKILRSPLPHAKIRDIDVSGARDCPGVLSVVTGRDTLGQKYGRVSSADEYGLAVDKVRYIGDEVAAVAAVSEEAAEKALELIEVDYEEQEALPDIGAATKEGAPAIHCDVPGNISYVADFGWGDVDAGFEEAEYIREDSFWTQAQIHASLEPHAAVARYNGSELTVWSCTQGPYHFRRDLAKLLGIAEGNIRVIKPTVGGGFGGKREVLSSDFCAALLAIKTRRPVKIVYSRYEEFIASRQRHPMKITLKTGVNNNGTVVAKECTLYADGGAYNSRGPGVIQYAGTSLASLYRIPNIRFKGLHVYTNKPVGGAMRGYGSLQLRFADESQMDIIANDLGLDPINFRLLNAVKEGDETASGRVITSCGFEECLKGVARAIGRVSEADTVSAGCRVGIGIAANDYVSGLRSIEPYDSSTVIIKTNRDGSVDLLSGTAEIGQGSDTMLAQVAAEELGIALENVKVYTGDTRVTPPDLGSYASRVTFVAGNAAVLAARDVKRQLFEELSSMTGISEGTFEVRGGEVRAGNANGSYRASFAEAVQTVLDDSGQSIVGHASYDASSERVDYETGSGNPAPSYSYGVQAAKVEVDPDMGTVRVLRVIAVTDCGRVLNPICVEGQAQGSIVCGMGMALYEDRLLKGGRTMNASFLDYMVPTALEVPEIMLEFADTIDPEGPFGAKGVSEGFQVPIAPAIANAVYDAIGVRIKELPITPEKIINGLAECEKEARRD